MSDILVKDSPIKAIITNLATVNPYKAEISWFTPDDNVTWRMMYGDRVVLPFIVEQFNQLPETFMDYLCQMIVNTFGYKWKTLYNTTVLAYNPIENYSMDETREKNNTSTATNKTDVGVNTFVSPFDSDTDLVEEGATKTGTSANTDAESVEDEKITRSGNIGTTTTQMMIESERELARFNLVKICLQDLAEFLTLNVM